MPAAWARQLQAALQRAGGCMEKRVTGGSSFWAHGCTCRRPAHGSCRRRCSARAAAWRNGSQEASVSGSRAVHAGGLRTAAAGGAAARGRLHGETDHRRLLFQGLGLCMQAACARQLQAALQRAGGCMEKRITGGFCFRV